MSAGCNVDSKWDQQAMDWMLASGLHHHAPAAAARQGIRSLAVPSTSGRPACQARRQRASTLIVAVSQVGSAVRLMPAPAAATTRTDSKISDLHAPSLVPELQQHSRLTLLFLTNSCEQLERAAAELEEAQATTGETEGSPATTVVSSAEQTQKKKKRSRRFRAMADLTPGALYASAPAVTASMHLSQYSLPADPQGMHVVGQHCSLVWLALHSSCSCVHAPCWRLWSGQQFMCELSGTS